VAFTCGVAIAQERPDAASPISAESGRRGTTTWCEPARPRVWTGSRCHTAGRVAPRGHNGQTLRDGAPPTASLEVRPKKCARGREEIAAYGRLDVRESGERVDAARPQDLRSVNVADARGDPLVEERDTDLRSRVNEDAEPVDDRVDVRVGEAQIRSELRQDGVSRDVGVGQELDRRGVRADGCGERRVDPHYRAASRRPVPRMWTLVRRMDPPRPVHPQVGVQCQAAAEPDQYVLAARLDAVDRLARLGTRSPDRGRLERGDRSFAERGPQRARNLMDRVTLGHRSSVRVTDGYDAAVSTSPLREGPDGVG
jgi:hypothetical protein